MSRMSPAVIRSTAAAALAVALSLASSRAGATPAIAGRVQQAYGLAAQPPCTLCHAGTPSAATAVTTFAAALKCRGVTANELGQLDTALADLDKTQPAVAQALRDGKTSDEVQTAFSGDPCAGATPGPQYGCSAARSRSDAHGDGAVLGGAGIVALALLLAGSRRRRQAG